MKLPQLTLRDLFWLVLVCALAVGWWVDRYRYLFEPHVYRPGSVLEGEFREPVELHEPIDPDTLRKFEEAAMRAVADSETNTN